ncbi:circadian clock KaiB family protein [Chryseolinea sp. T2]|uniref:circadian clock KaiB family protein n=1 Tax=Chryseolinea sp. T2 TaxID=3129255 RepID=UPI0030785B6B
MKPLDPNIVREYDLKLFVSGASPNSLKAINNIRRILEAHVSGKYDLQIIDVYQEKSIAQREQIVALPMLVRKHPLPERRLIGDMSNELKVIEGLGLNHDA